MEHFAERLHASPRGVFVWSMGITQHTSGADTVRAIANLALTQEYVGRQGCGLMPIRGHSGVQGGAEMERMRTYSPAASLRMRRASRASESCGVSRSPRGPG